jgi:hypothetical protein
MGKQAGQTASGPKDDLYFQAHVIISSLLMLERSTQDISHIAQVAVEARSGSPGHQSDP